MNIAKTRLYAQQISPVGDSVLDVVRNLGAVQSQDYYHSLHAVGIRTKNTTAEDIEAELKKGTILRTWPMRGTIHIIPAEDAGWMLELMAKRVIARVDKALGKQFPFTKDDVDLAEKVFIAELSGGKIVSRKSLVESLVQAGIDKEKTYFLFAYLSQAGVICLGPQQDKEQTFVLLSEWAPQQRMLSYEESLAEIAKRFFVSHGPATVLDFANWSGLKISEAKLGLENVKTQLTGKTINGVEYWFSPNAKESSGVFLLPAFDELLVGYKDRSPAFETYGEVAISTVNGIFHPTIIVDGQVVGTWKRVLKNKTVDITLQPAIKLNDNDMQQVVKQAEAVATFVGKTLRFV